MVEKIISGGQTGVDRAALDAALRRGFPCGGWCPKGRLAEDGRIAPGYPLVESKTPIYAERTRLNVKDSDGTLVLCPAEPAGGTLLTVNFARAEKRPCLVLTLDAAARAAAVLEWVKRHDIRVMNVAGPRESSHPGVYQSAVAFLEAVLEGSGR